MRTFIPFLGLCVLTLGFGATALADGNQLNVAFGASVPVDSSGQTLTEKTGPSRASGGEHFVVRFGRAKNITDIKLTAYSAGHAGKALIHSVTAMNGTTKVSIDALSQFAKVTAGNPTNYQNLVMLPDTAFVQTTPNQAFTQLDIVIEGFTNNDISVLLQVSSSDAIAAKDYLISRSSVADTLGGLIDESKFAKFTTADLQSLMTQAEVPAAADLAGKTFSCSNYPRLDANQVNYKTRTYAEANGALVSNSDLEGQNVWTATPAGLQMSIDNFNGCGKYASFNILRMTAGGNLISEIVVVLDDFLNLCEAAHYDRNAVRDVELNSTFTSVLDPKYVVDSYEFCHN